MLVNESRAMSGVDAFDTAPAAELRPRLLTLTASEAWADALLSSRPYGDLESLLSRSDAIVVALPEAEVDAALAGHPRIGEDVLDLDQDSARRSGREQAGMLTADQRTRSAMAAGNRAYEQRFGRIYLVAAAGRSADELLELLQQRLDNDPDAELDVVRRELARITRLRLAGLLHEESAGVA